MKKIFFTFLLVNFAVSMGAAGSDQGQVTFENRRSDKVEIDFDLSPTRAVSIVLQPGQRSNSYTFPIGTRRIFVASSTRRDEIEGEISPGATIVYITDLLGACQFILTHLSGQSNH